MKEKELRLALVCYGGVSLAVYMHGITKEVWKLLRASRAAHEGDAAGLRDSEGVYLDLLEAIGAHVRLRVLVDIVAGASAGGINGIHLAHAIAGGHDMDPLRDLWLERADVEVLLDPEAKPSSRWSKFYAVPIAWFAGRREGEAIDRIEDPATREEVRAKLSRFIRSRWFEPPFSGPGFTRLLYDSLQAMAAGERGPPLLPANQPLDLFVTVTDFYGHPERLLLHSPSEVVETEHRLVIDFHDDGRSGSRRHLASGASLTFAARATASFPGAFPPFQASELDAVIEACGDCWPDRKTFLDRIFPRLAAAGLDPATATLIDGSVLNNAPFRPAIDALRNRPAHREVDRRVVYIDPKPGVRAIHGPALDPHQPPGFFTTILRALADIPREQPIRDNLQEIEQLSRRVRRLREIVAGMRSEVDTAIERALGRGLFLFRLSPARLSNWRSRVQTAAAREASYAYAAYARLKLIQVVDAIAVTLTEHGGHSGHSADAIRAAVRTWVQARGIDHVVPPPKGREANRLPYVDFLRRFDLQYRIRRLRFLIRRVTEIAADAPAGQDLQPLEQLKAVLYDLLAVFLDRRTPAFLEAALAQPTGEVSTEPDRAIDHYGDALGLTALDAATDARLVELLNGPSITASVRRALILAYLGFPFFDIATLPLLQGDGLDEFDEIKVDRISPDDATSIREGGADATLKGGQFNAFGAFFARAWRENDYLWGRLHGADRLIDIVVSALPDGATLAPGVVATLKRRAFRAILEAERDHLRAIPDLLAALDKEISPIPL